MRGSPATRRPPALARLDWSVPEGTDAVIVELGANDTLRGIDPKVTREALEGIVGRLRERRIEVLLAGMRAAPNLGPDYGRDFDAIYADLAARERPAALSLFPRRRRHRRQAQPARRLASDRGRRRRASLRASCPKRKSWWRGCATNAACDSSHVNSGHVNSSHVNAIRRCESARVVLYAGPRIPIVPCLAFLPVSKSPPMSGSRSPCCAADCRAPAGSTPRTTM